MVAEEVKGKGKRGLLRIVFGRTTFFILFMALQIAVLAWIYFWLDDRYQAYGYGAFGLVSAILAIRILNEKQNASFKMAWLVPVLLFPVFGCLFYIFVQLQMETKILARRIADIKARTRSFLSQNESIEAKLMKENRRNANLSRYLSERAGYPVYDKTNFKYYPLGDDFFPDLLEELQAAERFIFLEYFIIQRGVMWDSVLKILEEKAAAGVDVRLLYDGMNSFSNLPHDYPKELEAKGIRCRIFNPIRPAISTSQNNRDHRKILVVDGHTAFTGGVNLADEYINRKVRFGHWKDNAIRLKGGGEELHGHVFTDVGRLHLPSGIRLRLRAVSGYGRPFSQPFLKYGRLLHPIFRQPPGRGAGGPPGLSGYHLPGQTVCIHYDAVSDSGRRHGDGPHLCGQARGGHGHRHAPYPG